MASFAAQILHRAALAAVACGLLYIRTVSLELVGHLVGVCVLAAAANPCAVPPKQKRNEAAREADKSQQRAGPLIAEPVVHLLREENTSGTPKGSEEGLCCQSRCCLVLIRVDEIVVGGIVEEDEAKSDGEAA